MSDQARLIATREANGAHWIWLNRPERHNALVPDLIKDLRAAVEVAAQKEPAVLVLSGRGPSFSTGGDLDGFLEHARSRQTLLDYSDNLVGGLHAAILDLLAFPAPVLCAVNGPVTGGSAGLMLAADMVAMSENAFVQPYYCDVGFGPDGGWTALLPERVGVTKALQIQYFNTRISASEALNLGLAASVDPAAGVEKRVAGWVADLGARFRQTHQVTRKNVWDEIRLNEVRERLDQERQRFLELVVQPETLAGIRTFLKKRA